MSQSCGSGGPLAAMVEMPDRTGAKFGFSHSLEREGFSIDFPIPFLMKSIERFFKATLCQVQATEEKHGKATYLPLFEAHQLLHWKLKTRCWSNSKLSDITTLVDTFLHVATYAMFMDYIKLCQKKS